METLQSIIVSFIYVGVTGGIVYIADSLFLKGLSPFIRYPLIIVCVFLGVILTAFLAGPILKNLEKRETKAAEVEEREHLSFVDSSDDEQRYKLYIIQYQQLEQLRKINVDIKIIKYVLICLVILFVFVKILR
ncbi:MAG: hypothetical protein HY752_05410 [Nitrospirae bacterium]|nr:hypothetical protein [Nitrospirota bacterium]